MSTWQERKSFRSMPSMQESRIQGFWSLTRPKGKCLEWAGKKDPNGYGTFYFSGENYRAHRISFWLANKSDPGAYQVCHSCDNPWCVEPNHLFLGTASDNLKDCVAKGRHPLASKTHCKNGHELKGEHIRLIVRPDGRHNRECLLCKSARQRAWKAKNKELQKIHNRKVSKKRKAERAKFPKRRGKLPKEKSL